MLLKFFAKKIINTLTSKNNTENLTEIPKAEETNNKVKLNQIKNELYFLDKSDEKYAENIGALGELQVLVFLQSLKVNKKLLNNIYIKTYNEGSTEIDIIMIHETGIYIFEIKNYGGWIFGNENDTYWTKTLNFGQEKHRFYNPVMQNNGHIKAISKIMPNIPIENYYSYILFGTRCELKNIVITSNNVSVLKYDKFKHIIRYELKKRKPILSNEEIEKIYEVIKFNCIKDKKENLEEMHINNIKKIINMCPKCKSTLVERTNRKTNEKFLGCSNFPKCNYTSKYEK